SCFSKSGKGAVVVHARQAAEAVNERRHDPSTTLKSDQSKPYPGRRVPEQGRRTTSMPVIEITLKLGPHIGWSQFPIAGRRPFECGEVERVMPKGRNKRPS